MPSYSVNLNAVVAQAATAVTRLQVVCSYGGSDSQVCVATAANLALAGGKLRGVALENQAAGFPIQIIDYGSVNATLTGSGIYVNYDASGNLARSSTPGSNTVGTYENGVIHVNLDFPSTGGNATSIGGVSVTAASAGYSQELAGNGIAIRARRDRSYHLVDFRDKAAANLAISPTPALDSSSNAMAVNAEAWRLACLEISNLGGGANLFICHGDWYFNTPLKAWNGKNYLVGFNNVTIVWENGRSIGSSGARFVFQMSDYTGTSATFSAYGNGGSGQKMMTLTGAANVTTALASEIVGLPVRIWGAATPANVVDSFVTSVPANGSFTFWNDQAGATAVDANNGAIHYRIERACLDIRAREMVYDSMHIVCIGDTGCYFNETESPSPANADGQGATTITSNKMVNCYLHADGPSEKVRAFKRLAADIVPDSNHASYSVNGAGVPQVYAPFQVDVTEYHDCRFIGNIASKCSGVLAYGRAGQAESHMFRGGYFQGVRNGWTVPKHSASNASNLAHADFYDMGIGFAYDTVFDVCTSSFGCIVSRCRGEAGAGRLLNDRGGVAPNEVIVEGCDVTYYAYNDATNPGHPTWDIISTNREGAIVLQRNRFILGGDSSHYRILGLNHSRGGSNNNVAVVTFTGNTVGGTMAPTGRRGYTDATIPGPYVFAGTEVLTLPVKVGGVTTNYNITFSQANLNAALGYTVNLHEVRAFEVATLIEKTIGRSIVRAYGSEDDRTLLRVWNNDETTGGVTSIGAASGTANAILGFTGVGTPSARLQMNTDTLGAIDGSAISSSDEVELAFYGNKFAVNSGASASASPSFFKVYGTASQGFWRLETVQGIAGIGARAGVPPKNFNGSISITGAATTGTVTLPFTEDDNLYLVMGLGIVATSAAPATRSARVQNGSQTTTQFVVELDAAPGVGQSVQVNWMVTR